jgi:hypothetical protein
MKKYLLLVLILAVVSTKAFAQDSTAAKVDEVKDALNGLNESYLETKSTVDALKKIKVSGYIQTQYQNAESDGAGSFAGGNFGSGIHQRFGIRRGRIKFNYDNDLTQFVLQFDITEKGFGTKDAYISFTEPWLKTFGLTGGIFDRPFGYEISYSSSSRETPERSRMFQTLFPGERDLGFKLEIKPQDGPLSFLNLKAGLFAGNGINPETDNNKDFIGRLGFSFPFTEANLAIDGGFSAYIGKVNVSAPTTTTSTSYTGTIDTDGKTVKITPVTTTTTKTYSVYKADNASAAVQDNSGYADRQYYGADIQLYYDLPVIGGFSLKGEYIFGKQPGTSSSNASYTAAATGDVFLRNFMGYYITYVQNIGDVNQFVVKYDVFDPNTDVSDNEIGLNAAAKLGAGDIKYSTLGLGWIYHWDSNVKLVWYYDMVSSEKSANLKAFNDDLKDNVFTFRIQYKF